jgi:hypothetical protein
MGMKFNRRVYVVNQTLRDLGLAIMGVGLLAVLGGIVTSFSEDFILPSPAWCVLGVILVVVGGVILLSGLRW